MSVPAFIDVTEEDQALELRAYIKSKGAEISEENSEGGLHVDLAQIIEACDVCLKDDDKDVESVMNSIVSLLLILETEKQEALIESLCEKLVKFREGERPSLRMQLLSNLFHGMDETTSVRYTVYCSLIKVAATCNAIAFIPTELEQALELRAYIKSKGAEISEENSEGGLHVDLAQIIEACDVCLKDDDKDVESVMNSIVSLLLILETEKQEALIESLCEKLVKFREGERPSLRMQLLSNLFHGMDETTSVRYTVYCSLIKVAATCNAIAFIPTELEQVRKWITDWNLTIEKKHTLLRLVYEALIDCKKSDAAAKVMVELLGSYTEDNASQARVDAHRCIVRALKDPNTFLFDHLLALKPVRFLEGELIHDLLTIFVSAKLAAYVKFYQNNKDFIDSLGLSHEQNMEKMRLLTFMGMAVECKEISFDTIQQELQIGADDVEAFVIDAVRTKMVYCKIDQTQRKVVVSHSTHRTFGKQQWQQLYDSLSAWKQSLSTVKTSLLGLSTTS
ncbi:UNVERIFIED_CONTAM: hypothetical protein FKN15_037556 [Acipenser sinensis]